MTFMYIMNFIGNLIVYKKVPYDFIRKLDS